MTGFRVRPYTEKKGVFWTSESLQQLGREFVRNMYTYFSGGYHTNDIIPMDDEPEITSLDDLFER